MTMKKVTSKNVLNQISEFTFLLPFFTGYCILYGAINVISFYNQFGIEVIGYIDLSELLSYFIKDIYLMIAQFFMLIFVLMGAEWWATKKEKLSEIDLTLMEMNKLSLEDMDKMDEEEREKLMTKLKSIISSTNKKQIGNIFVMVILLFVLAVLCFLVFLILGAKSVIIFSSAVIMWLAFDKNIKHYIVLSFLSVVLVLSYLNAVYLAEIVKGGRNYGLNFSLNGEVIKSDSMKYVIGRTNKYIFYYDSNAKSSKVYSIDKIDFINIPYNEEEFISKDLKRAFEEIKKYFQK